MRKFEYKHDITPWDPWDSEYEEADVKRKNAELVIEYLDREGVASYLCWKCNWPDDLTSS